MDNQQVSSKQEKLQRLSLLRGVHYKLLVVEVGRPKQVMLQDKIQSVLNRNIKKFIRELHKKQRFYVNDNLKIRLKLMTYGSYICYLKIYINPQKYLILINTYVNIIVGDKNGCNSWQRICIFYIISYSMVCKVQVSSIDI